MDSLRARLNSHYYAWRCKKKRRKKIKDVITVFHVWAYGRFAEMRGTSGERNFIERIKAPIFLEAVLAMEIMQEPQSNLEEKVNPSILIYDFSSRADPFIFTLTAPVLIIRTVKRNQLNFSSIEINKPWSFWSPEWM